MSKTYTPEVESIRQNLIKEVKKTLPFPEENIEIKSVTDNCFYVGASIDSLSLSDLALMIDEPRI